MDAAYLRALAFRCRKAGRDCNDPFAKEEFQHLANELDTRARESEDPQSLVKQGAWLRRREQPRGFQGDG
jgi:hypothetical protein